MNKKNLEDKLHQAFSPTHLVVEDESHLHAGHAGVQERGGSHFSVVIVSDAFDGKNKVARQRLVYKTLELEMANEDRAGLHALRMQTHTPSEWEALA